ncbi:hybrid sensor histidine kinase/response regulator [Babesia caballi]|uniref:Hybrid sensor histidine kinase/response regulator n=1 Tax=Babesia caballi TaxID=5871 RepID=A0AAV4LUU7_BABCB|nr:hybrid sensor histidine kinase/response regulator [Babesia caballi]
MVTHTSVLAEMLGLKAHGNMAKGTGTGGKVIRSARMPTAHTLDAVGEEGLEGGVGAITAPFELSNVSALVTAVVIMVTLVVSALAVMLTPRNFTLQTRADMGCQSLTGAIRLHFLPISTIIPTAFIYIGAAH